MPLNSQKRIAQTTQTNRTTHTKRTPLGGTPEAAEGSNANPHREGDAGVGE